MWHRVLMLGKNKDSLGILIEFITECRGPFSNFAFNFLLQFEEIPTGNENKKGPRYSIINSIKILFPTMKTQCLIQV